MNAARAYVNAAKETASKERLMVMLFETALRSMRLGATLLEEKKLADGLQRLTRASDIVTELASTIDPSHNPELAQTLSDLYLFVAERLAHGAAFHDVNAVRDAERAFAPIVDAFQQAVAQVTGGR